MSSLMNVSELLVLPRRHITPHMVHACLGAGIFYFVVS
jgi:hypothetical protein